MTITQANMAVCQKALYLLRQDVGLPALANAATDDSLEWQKCRIAFDTAISEVWAAHAWNDELKLTGATLTGAPTDCTNWSEPMRTALAYRLAGELAIPLAGRMQDLQSWMGLYGQKLQLARVWSLEKERAGVTDGTMRAMLSNVVPRFAPEDKALPRSVKTITDRAAALLDSARYAVLISHAWNFARCEDSVAGCELPHGCWPYSFAAGLPPGCVHLEAVLSADGSLADWKVQDGAIVAHEPPAHVVYIRDDRRPERWPPLVRQAFILRLSADVAQTEMPELHAILEQRYQAALSEAKLRDAKESNTPRDAWGRNHHVDRMRGLPPDGAPRQPRHAFHGLV